jgi:hypothetical protein
MLLLNALLSDQSTSNAILSVIRKLTERHITLRWLKMSQDFFSCIRPSPLQKILHEKLIVIGLVNKLSAFLWAPTIFNCVSWSAIGPYPEEIQCNILYQIILFKIYSIFVPPWSTRLPNCSFSSSFRIQVLYSLIFSLLHSYCNFYDVTVNFTMPQFVLNAISRGYKLSRPNIHRTRTNKLRRTSITIMFSAEGVWVVPPLSPT